MPLSLTKYRGTVGILKNRLFVEALKYKVSLVNHSKDLCSLDYVFHYCDIRFTFCLLLVAAIKMQCMQKYNTYVYYLFLLLLSTNRLHYGRIIF